MMQFFLSNCDSDSRWHLFSRKLKPPSDKVLEVLETYTPGWWCGKLFCTPFEGQQFRRRRAAWTIWTEAGSQGISCEDSAVKKIHCCQKCISLSQIFSDILRSSSAVHSRQTHILWYCTFPRFYCILCCTKSPCPKFATVFFEACRCWGGASGHHFVYILTCHFCPCLHVLVYFAGHQSHCTINIDQIWQGARKYLQNRSTAREASLWGVQRSSWWWGAQNAMGLQPEETFVAPRAVDFDPSNLRQRTSMSKLSEIVLIAHMQLVAQDCLGCSASWKPWLSETNAQVNGLTLFVNQRLPAFHLVFTCHTAFDSADENSADPWRSSCWNVPLN